MPAAKTPPAAAPESMYPVIEEFVERASPDDVSNLFHSIREGLDELKGPRAEHAKKIQTAISRTEELLSHLLQVREKLAQEKGAGASKRR